MHQPFAVWRHEAAALFGAERFFVELHRLHATTHRQVRTNCVIALWNRLNLWCHAILLCGFGRVVVQKSQIVTAEWSYQPFGRAAEIILSAKDRLGIYT